MTYQKWIYSLILLVTVYGCNQLSTTTDTTATGGTALSTTANGETTTVSGVTTTTSSQIANYTVSSFSEYIYFSNDGTKILVDLNFFPDGSDLCQQATYDATTNPNGCEVDKSIVIPCEFQSLAENELLSISVSADSETTQCENNVVMDLSSAEFTVDGLVFTFASSLDVFSDDFEFKIKTTGFYDSQDDAKLTLSGTSINMEDVYNAIVDKRAQ